MAVFDELHSLRSTGLIKDLALIVGDYFEEGFRDALALEEGWEEAMFEEDERFQRIKRRH